MSKTISQLDAEGYFVGATFADSSPLEPGVFLIPGGAVDAAPPVVPEGRRARWNGSGFDLEGIPQPAVPPAPTFAEMLTAKRAEIAADCEKAIAAIRAGYPESEVLSWPKQEAEARAFVADASAATPLLDALATARGIDKATLAARVIAKADAFAALSGALIGKRQKLEDQLAAATTAEEAAAIVW